MLLTLLFQHQFTTFRMFSLEFYNLIKFSDGTVLFKFWLTIFLEARILIDFSCMFVCTDFAGTKIPCVGGLYACTYLCVTKNQEKVYKIYTHLLRSAWKGISFYCVRFFFFSIALILSTSESSQQSLNEWSLSVSLSILFCGFILFSACAWGLSLNKANSMPIANANTRVYIKFI